MTSCMMQHLKELLPHHIIFPYPTISLTIPLEGKEELVGIDLIFFIAAGTLLCFGFVTNKHR